MTAALQAHGQAWLIGVDQFAPELQAALGVIRADIIAGTIQTAPSLAP